MVLPEQAPPCSHSTLVIDYVFFYWLLCMIQVISIVAYHLFLNIYLSLSRDGFLIIYAKAQNHDY
ncbi:hypothetical protein NIES37_15230 [Tolypothrix tenuis PCC 7101]|uniref:Uncharacterized protein n=1 Tax=Tolypothrix tenuis PCC 7101 TaxID=231146 RepID=A0A1Z4MVX7_9CYAN|nr:hypothetical protein NIES2107_33820 [Nostoc carneum NIES-2107]BAY97581.1 hypothetical protein NIES37_15230 [Tolypothrix tenuis PCC 7101]BAZ71911.1 hypothetical protein NIES50_04600 [Aulosira laxa NIES-50]